MESHDLKKFGKNAKRNNSVECQYFYGILQGGKKGGVHCTLYPNTSKDSRVAVLYFPTDI